MAYIGKGVPGKLDHILVAGEGQYTADVLLPGMGFMTILRSPLGFDRYACWLSDRKLRRVYGAYG